MEGLMALAIYGTGGYGREVASFARRFDDIVFVTDDDRCLSSSVNDIQTISFEELVERRLPVCVAVADGAIRRRLADKCKSAGVPDGRAIAQTSIVGDGVNIGGGSILSDFTILTADVNIGRHFHANIYSYVAHDCIIGDFVTLAPRVCVNGNTIIEDDVYIGTGAIIRQGASDRPLRIGRGAIIGMGAVVTRDVEPGETVIGNPARPMNRVPG
jgi:sugar O-acyltransferase (sialic acid O-acetyltransferase NeuD family)